MREALFLTGGVVPWDIAKNLSRPVRLAMMAICGEIRGMGTLDFRTGEWRDPPSAAPRSRRRR